MTAKLRLEADQTIASWGVTGLSYKIKGKFATISHDGKDYQCRTFQLIQMLNSIAVEAL
jgi:hypothetical protein